MEPPSVLQNIDRSKFFKFPYLKRIEKPWGFEIIFTPSSLPYTGKILHITGGKETSLQAHDEKIESWYLISGKVSLIRDDKDGKLQEIYMQPEAGYTNYIGQRHRFRAITDVEILEVSSPESGNTFRFEDDYNRPTETEALRAEPNRGWIE